MCEQCPSGKIVVTGDIEVVGQKYTPDLTECQACPDVKMKFRYTAGSFYCDCPSDYNVAGVTKIGTISCLPKGILHRKVAFMIYRSLISS